MSSLLAKTGRYRPLHRKFERDYAHVPSAAGIAPTATVMLAVAAEEYEAGARALGVHLQSGLSSWWRGGAAVPVVARQRLEDALGHERATELILEGRALDADIGLHLIQDLARRLTTDD